MGCLNIIKKSNSYDIHRYIWNSKQKIPLLQSSISASQKIRVLGHLMLLPVVSTYVRPQIWSWFLLFLAVGTLKFYIGQVQRLDMIRDNVFQMMHFAAERALPQSSSVFRGQLFHVLKDRGLKKIWGIAHVWYSSIFLCYGLSGLVLGPDMLVCCWHVWPQVRVTFVSLLAEITPIPYTQLVTMPAFNMLPNFFLTFTRKFTKPAGKLSFPFLIKAFFQVAQYELGHFWELNES